MATAMDSISSATATTWPPLSLTTPDGRTSCEEFCRHAQDLEVANKQSSSGGTNNTAAVSLQVQMACLLILGDTAACRHLWRRHRDDDSTNTANNNSNNNRTALEPWWKIAAAMISHRYAAVWEGLQSLVTSTNPSVTCLPTVQTYVSEIAEAYRQRLLKALMQKPPSSSSVMASSSSTTTTTTQALPGYYTAVFGFSQPGELQDYYQKSLLEHQQLLVGGGNETTGTLAAQERSTLTSFLEAQRRPV